MVRWVLSSWIPRVRGRTKRAGLFGVPKSSGELLWLIVDRRPANWSEFNLRELLLQDLKEDKVSFTELESLWRLMSLPYESTLQDFFLGSEGRLQ
eukprot:5443414-Amphidinium_carterae.1